MTKPSPVPSRAPLRDAILVLAVSAACLITVFAPTPPSAWASVAPGLLLLAVAVALWLLDDRRPRRALAVAVATAALNVGFAVDALPGDVLAAVLISAAAVCALAPAPHRPRRPIDQDSESTTSHD